MTSTTSPQRHAPANGLSVQAVGMGVLAALVGYASSVAIVVQGLAAVGADPAQLASGLMALGLAMGLPALWLSWQARIPISTVWTTPGLALLAATGPVAGGFPAALGAFIVVGGLIMVAGLWSPLGRWVMAIPKPLANAMLAGILLKLCLAPFVALGQVPAVALPVLAAWVVVGRFERLYAVPAAVAVAIALTAMNGMGTGLGGLPPLPQLDFIQPLFTWEATVGIALPLFIVTMASQNIPGAAVLAANGYEPPVRRIFLTTGAFSAAAALFGSPSINLAAITAALCAGPDADPNPQRRWQSAFAAGVVYIGLAALAAVTASLVTRSPPVVIEAVAGLALIGAFGSAAMGAVQAEEHRLPALVTLLVTASGVSFWGIGSAFWGLLIGGAMYALQQWRPGAAR